MHLRLVHAAPIYHFTSLMARFGGATDLQGALSLSSCLPAPTEAFYLRIPKTIVSLPLAEMEYCPEDQDLLESDLCTRTHLRCY